MLRLEKFFAHKQHTKCLQSLHGNRDYSDYNIQVILAVHLFGPLAGDDSFKIENKDFPKDGKARRCPVCEHEVSSAFQDTSLGNGKVWHGYADILVKRSVVKVRFEENGSGEPLQKRRRIGSTADDVSSSSDESDDSDSIVEAKKNRAISQGLAQTIVNSFCEAKNNPSLLRSFIPSFIVTGRSVRICMYNCGIDSLIMTKDLALFVSESDMILNFQTILSIWYALNFKTFYDDINYGSEFIDFNIKSNFKEHVGLKYPIYTDNCTKPMTPKEEGEPEEFNINFKFVLTAEYGLLKEMVEKNENIKSFLSKDS